MTTQPPTTPPDKPPSAPEPVLVPRRGWLPSLVWLIPIVSLVAGLILIGQQWFGRGTTITISFKTAEGLEAGQTKVRYKDVNIGEVKNISLSEDRSHVLVKVELTKSADSFAVKDSRFWVVRPRVAASGISGLSTVFSGSFIGVDAGKSREEEHTFTGLETPPIVTGDQAGRQFVLHASELASVDIGSPVYYRRVSVGQVVAYKLDADGKGVTLRIFVNAPYDRFVTADSRFWQASGISANIDTNGVKIKTQSLVAVMLGGIAFQEPPDSTVNTPAPTNMKFLLADDETAAMRTPVSEAILVGMDFDQSLRGLKPGAPVDFRGVTVGEVKKISIEFEQNGRIHVPVLVEIFPSQLGLTVKPSSARADTNLQAQIDRLVSQGLRAQLKLSNLLSGQLYVALDFFPRAKPARIDWHKTIPQMPTEANPTEQLQGKLVEIANKLSKVPFDRIGTHLDQSLVELKTSLNDADALFRQLDQQVVPEAKATLQEARKSFSAAQQTLSADAPLQQDARNALQELQRAAESLRVLSDYLSRHPESLIRGKARDEP